MNTVAPSSSTRGGVLREARRAGSTEMGRLVHPDDLGPGRGGNLGAGSKRVHGVRSGTYGSAGPTRQCIAGTRWKPRAHPERQRRRPSPAGSGRPPTSRSGPGAVAGPASPHRPRRWRCVEFLSELQEAAPDRRSGCRTGTRPMRPRERRGGGGRRRSPPPEDLGSVWTLPTREPELWSAARTHLPVTCSAAGEAVRNLPNPLGRRSLRGASPGVGGAPTTRCAWATRSSGVGLVAVDVTERLQAQGFRSDG